MKNLQYDIVRIVGPKSEIMFPMDSVTLSDMFEIKVIDPEENISPTALKFLKLTQEDFIKILDIINAQPYPTATADDIKEVHIFTGCFEILLASEADRKIRVDDDFMVLRITPERQFVPPSSICTGVKEYISKRFNP